MKRRGFLALLAIAGAASSARAQDPSCPPDPEPVQISAQPSPADVEPPTESVDDVEDEDAPAPDATSGVCPNCHAITQTPDGWTPPDFLDRLCMYCGWCGVVFTLPIKEQNSEPQE